ncbi:MAG: HEAT repeat domain-containing protein, partial [Gemmataceae bacterium]|nr:HEAT repeat domain-containing protein [Gemmataceae bacterium]
ACLLLALATSVRGQDKDPTYDGKTFAQWVGVLQNDKSARQRALAVEALGKVWIAEPKTDALSYVVTTLRDDPSPAVRAQSAIVLAGLRETDMLKYAATPLVEALKKEKDSRVRKEIVAAVAKHPGVCVSGVEPLAGVLGDPDAAVRAAAADALALAGEKAKSAAGDLLPLLKDEDKRVKLSAIYALGRIKPDGASTIAETMAGLLATSKDTDVRRELIRSLGLLGEASDPVVKGLAALLSDKEDEELRRAAVRTLGTFGTSAGGAADALFKVVKEDKAKDVRVDAVRSFGSALGKEGVKARLKDLRPQLDPVAQPDFEVRLALVEEIGALGYEHLGADLTATDSAVKAEAQETLRALRI